MEKASAKPKSASAVFLGIIDVLSSTGDISDKKGKRKKIKAANELQNLMLDRKTMQTFGIPNAELCWRMIEKNIFRPLKSRRTLKIDFSETGFEQPDQTSDNEGMVYTLIEGVYQFFWDMIKSEHMSVKQLKSFITADFLSAFLELFDSNEQNERPYLKKILHTMYAKVVSRRKLIRKSINDTLYQLIHEGFSFNGTSELLEILASIISGFGVPLREENLIFFHKIIIQLHKVQTVGTFFDNLAKGSMLYLSKDKTLAVPLVKGILKYWPFANKLKENLFFMELREIIDLLDDESFKEVIHPLTKRIAKGISGEGAYPAQSALDLVESEGFVKKLKSFSTTIYPLLVPSLMQPCTQSNPYFLNCLDSIKRMLKEIDPVAYEQAVEDYSQKEDNQSTITIANRNRLDGMWSRLDQKLLDVNPLYEKPTLPFDPSTLPMHCNWLYDKIQHKERYLYE